MALSTITSIASRGINLLISIISVPLLLNYLGAERYGMYAMVTSIQGFMMFSDFGLGLGLQNRIPEFQQHEDKTVLHKAISSTFFTLAAIVLLLFLLLTFSIRFADWAHFYNVSTPLASNEASPISWAFFICFFVGLPFNVAFYLLTGSQQAYKTEIWRTLGNLLSLLLLLLFTYLKVGTPFLIYSAYGSISLATIAAFIFVFNTTDKNLLPNIKLWNYEMVKNISIDGSKYFILQIFAIGLTTVDSFFIAHYQSTESVSIFMIGFRIVSIITLPLVLINSQFLPSLNDAIVKNDFVWIKKSIKNLLRINSIYVVIVSIILFFTGDFLLKIWLKNTIYFDTKLWLGFICLFIFSAFNWLLSCVFLTPSLVKFNLKIFPIAVIAIVLVKFFAIQYFSIGEMLMLSLLTYSIFFFMPALIKLKKSNFY